MGSFCYSVGASLKRAGEFMVRPLGPCEAQRCQDSIWKFRPYNKTHNGTKIQVIFLSSAVKNKDFPKASLRASSFSSHLLITPPPHPNAASARQQNICMDPGLGLLCSTRICAPPCYLNPVSKLFSHLRVWSQTNSKYLVIVYIFLPVFYIFYSWVLKFC